mgnify:CR=1 FL=1
MFGIDIKPFYILSIAILALAAEPLLAEEKCNVLGSLQADPIAIAEPVEFANIKPLVLIADRGRNVKVEKP